MSNQTLFTFLTRSQLFAGLTAEEISNLFIHVNYKVMHMRKNEIYTFAGMDHFYATIVLKGRMQGYMMSHTGKTVRVAAMEEGDMIAPALLFSPSHVMPVTVKADDDASILRFAVGYLEEFINTSPKVLHNFIVILSSIVMRLQSKLYQLTMLPAKERIAHYLIDKAKEQGGKVIMLDGTRQELADYFGIQKFSLNRCLTQLVQEGLIAVEGRKVTIQNVAGLKKFY